MCLFNPAEPQLCLMSYLMSYDILSSYDLTALVYVLLFRLRLAISRLVSMHFVLCRFQRGGRTITVDLLIR